MSLFTLYGINGVGKDTIASYIKEKYPEINITSMSRLYMYILGITNTYDTSENVNENQYKVLESVPQEKMIRIENNEYKNIIIDISNMSKDTIFLGHLISVLRLGDKINYLTNRKTPNWFIDANKEITEVLLPYDVIADRRKQDVQRKRSILYDDIKFHQELCNKEWERIKNLNPTNENKMHYIENLNITESVSDFENIILGTNYDYIKKNDNKLTKKYLLK